MNKRIVFAAVIVPAVIGAAFYFHSVQAGPHSDAAAATTTNQTSPLIQDSVPTTPAETTQTDPAAASGQTSPADPASSPAPSNGSPSSSPQPAPAPQPSQPAPNTPPANPSPGAYQCPPAADGSNTSSCTSTAVGQ